MKGADLRALRKSANFSGVSLSAHLDISVATLSKYENDHSPIPKKVELAVRYLCEPLIHASEADCPEKRLITALKEITRQ